MTRGEKKRNKYLRYVAVLVRYKVRRDDLVDFAEESFVRILPILRAAPGFRRLLVMRDALNPEFVDVLTEWENMKAFERFATRHRTQVKPATPHEVLEKAVYVTFEIVE